MERWLSPAEVAARFGIGRKALRVYEAAGLVQPLRRPNGWRAYGPEALARLHQVRLLRRCGLPLARIAALLAGGAGLDGVLAAQQHALERLAGETQESLAVIRATRARLARGEKIDIENLVHLTETTMASDKTDWAGVMRPFVERQFSPEEQAAIGARKAEAFAAAGYDEAGFHAEWATLFREAEALMAADDTQSPRAQALARRWRDMVGHFTMGDPALAAKAGAVWREALADPAAAAQLPVRPAVFAFVRRIEAG